MDWLQNRRLLLTIGGSVAVLLLSLGLALALVYHDHESQKPPPASVGGLVVQMGPPQDAKLDPKQPLRCFVGGQFIGLETLSDCAQKNGVATNSLDVGGDASGAAPAPSPVSDGTLPDQPVAAQQAQGAVSPSRGPLGDCLRYGGSGWRKVADNLTLSECVQALFAGRCEKPGSASYGRWMTQTLRLSPHQVEGSTDNVNFHTLVEQSDAGCAIADF